MWELKSSWNRCLESFWIKKIIMTFTVCSPQTHQIRNGYNSLAFILTSNSIKCDFRHMCPLISFLCWTHITYIEVLLSNVVSCCCCFYIFSHIIFVLHFQLTVRSHTHTHTPKSMPMHLQCCFSFALLFIWCWFALPPFARFDWLIILHYSARSQMVFHVSVFCILAVTCLCFIIHRYQFW